MKSKICSKCGKEKDISEFYKDKKQKSGLYPSCKQCKVKIVKKNYKRKTIKLTNKEKLMEMLQEKRSITQKELLDKFDNRKELFKDLQNLIDMRIIGSTISINDGQTYYIKNL